MKIHSKNSRLNREGKTIRVMIEIYCRNQHSGRGFYPECSDLMNYALESLGKCPFNEGKLTCAKCKVHCYKPVMREKVRQVMGYSGPCMLYRHPIMTVYHLVDGIRKGPVRG
jgi:hypothetical protein